MHVFMCVYTCVCLREEVRWRQWADDWLVNLIKPNIFRSPAEALAAYEHQVQEGNYGAVEGVIIKHAGAFYMFFLSKLLKIWWVCEFTQLLFMVFLLCSHVLV